MVGKFFASLLCVALLLFAAAAHAYHHPGDAAPRPSKTADPIWNVVAALLVLGLAYVVWRVYAYNKKLRL